MNFDKQEAEKQADVGLSVGTLKRPLQGIVILVIAAFVLLAVSSTFAQADFTTNLNGGEKLDIGCSAEQLKFDTTSRTQVTFRCLGDSTDPPPPEPTVEPEPPNPDPPNPDPEPPNPDPDPPSGVSSPYGVYPDCIAPAVGLETQAWWHQNGEAAPRQINIASCLPNARGMDGGGVIVDGTIKAVVRVTAVNNPSDVQWVRYQWQGKTQETQRFGESCQTGVDEMRECSWYFEFNIDTDKMRADGLDELRMSPNIKHSDIRGRQFATLNFELHGGGSKNYRRDEGPRAQASYSGVGLTLVRWTDYMQSFSSLAQSIPVVSGTIDLNVEHDKGGGQCVGSAGYVDPAFNAYYNGSASKPVPFYETGDCFEGSQLLDTTQLSNGVHEIYLQTIVDGRDGTNTSTMVYKINVQN